MKTTSEAAAVKTIDISSRRAVLGLLALSGAGCGLVQVGGFGTGASNPSSSGATEAHLQRTVDEALRPEKVEFEAAFQKGVQLAAGRKGTPMTTGKPTPMGATMARMRASGAAITVAPYGDMAILRMEVDEAKAKGGRGAFDDRRNVETAFELLAEFGDKIRVEAVLAHLNVAIMMVGWRRDGHVPLGDEAAEVFRQAQGVARAIDTLSALTVSVTAMVQAVLANRAKPTELDAMLAKLADAPPVEESATIEEVRGLYDALPGTIEASIDELVRVTRERMPGEAKNTIPEKLRKLFEPLVALAKQADEAPAASEGGASATDVAGALLTYGSVLFPGLGVAIRGYEAGAALLEGKPEKAIELAATMVPGGTVALGIVRDSAKVLGVKVPGLG